MAVHDLGELGPKESVPVVASWPLVDGLSRLAVWGLLIAAFVLFKENHNARALLVLLPVVAVYVLWTVIRALLVRFTGMPSPAAALFDTLAMGFAVGIAVVLLVSARFRKTPRFVIVLAAFVVMTLAFGAGVAGSMQFDEEAAQLSILFGVMTLAGLVAMVVSGVLCRKHFGAVKFAVWLGLWSMLFCVVFTLVAVVVMMGGDIPPQTVVAGGIMGAILYVFLMPFVVLVLTSALFRERFYGCYRLKGMVQNETGQVANDRQMSQTSTGC